MWHKHFIVSFTLSFTIFSPGLGYSGPDPFWNRLKRRKKSVKEEAETRSVCEFASMADLKKDTYLTYAYLLLYIALSSGQIFFNKVTVDHLYSFVLRLSPVKMRENALSERYHENGSVQISKLGFDWVLSSKEINFPYPLGLTLLHMIFSSVLCFVLTKILKVMKVEEGMTPEIYATSVVPIGAMFAMTLWLGNTAYLYISVAFAQMLKAIMPVAVFVLGVAAGLEVMSCKMLLIMSVISFGVLVASYGEININWVGVVYQMGGVVGEALRLIFMEIFVKRKGLKLNPISVIALCLFLPWIFLEKSKMDEHGPWNFPPILLVLNCLCTFALNLSVFLVITHTSALTIRVAGVVKDWVVVLLSAALFADTKLTIINLFGYAIGKVRVESDVTYSTFCLRMHVGPSAIVGVAAYNNFKLKNEASRNTVDSEDESSQREQSQPLT
ncbi:putative sugar phosphate/phosphate translocator, partial [Mucuna pruriens]